MMKGRTMRTRRRRMRKTSWTIRRGSEEDQWTSRTRRTRLALSRRGGGG